MTTKTPTPDELRQQADQAVADAQRMRQQAQTLQRQAEEAAAALEERRRGPREKAVIAEAEAVFAELDNLDADGIAHTALAAAQAAYDAAVDDPAVSVEECYRLYVALRTESATRAAVLTYADDRHASLTRQLDDGGRLVHARQSTRDALATGDRGSGRPMIVAPGYLAVTTGGWAAELDRITERRVAAAARAARQRTVDRLAQAGEQAASKIS